MYILKLRGKKKSESRWRVWELMGGVEERHLQTVNSLRAVNSEQESRASGIPGADTPSPPRTQLHRAPLLLPRPDCTAFPLEANL